MSLKGTAANLAQAMKDLSIEWEQTKSYWRDAKAREFEHHYIEPIPDHVIRTMAVMEEIDTLLRKVRNDCE